VRSLVLLLLLANLLFAAWVHWVAPTRAPAVGTPTPSASDPGAIRLLREAQMPSTPSMPAEAADGTAPNLADAALACVSVGPYLERPLATQAEARLIRLGFAVRLREAREPVRVGDWVRVEDLATPEDAANALAQLRAAGVADAYVLTEDPPGTVISLGVFTDPERAEQARMIAKMAGFEPRTVERTREADVLWLDIDRQASAGLPSLEQLGADGEGRLPGIELRRCPAQEPPAGEAVAPAPSSP
jgi:hypothetical protein